MYIINPPELIEYVTGSKQKAAQYDVTSEDRAIAALRDLYQGRVESRHIEGLKNAIEQKADDEEANPKFSETMRTLLYDAMPRAYRGAAIKAYEDLKTHDGSNGKKADDLYMEIFRCKTKYEELSGQRLNFLDPAKFNPEDYSMDIERATIESIKRDANLREANYQINHLKSTVKGIENPEDIVKVVGEIRDNIAAAHLPQVKEGEMQEKVNHELVNIAKTEYRGLNKSTDLGNFHLRVEKMQAELKAAGADQNVVLYREAKLHKRGGGVDTTLAKMQENIKFDYTPASDGSLLKTSKLPSRNR